MANWINGHSLALVYQGTSLGEAETFGCMDQLFQCGRVDLRCRLGVKQEDSCSSWGISSPDAHSRSGIEW